MMLTPANHPTFEPPVLSNPAFMDWAIRVCLRLRNIPPGSPDGIAKRAILADGIPPPEWAHGLLFMQQQAQTNKREAISA